MIGCRFIVYNDMNCLGLGRPFGGLLFQLVLRLQMLFDLLDVAVILSDKIQNNHAEDNFRFFDDKPCMAWPYESFDILQ